MRFATWRSLPTNMILSALAVTAMLVLGVGAAPAFAEPEVPWWRVNAYSRPSYLRPGGRGTVVVAVSNLGDAVANGAGAPIVVTDTLPEGVTAESAEYFASNAAFGSDLAEEVPCSISAGRTVRCEFEGIMPPYARLEVKIRVEVSAALAEGRYPDAVSVSGGGAVGVSVRDRATELTVSESSTPFGVEAYELTPENADGSLDTQAGSHPFQLTGTVVLNQDAETGLEYDQVGEVMPVVLPKDLRAALPPGVIGNPTPFPRCPEELFFKQECPADTQVGVAMLTIAEPLYSAFPVGIYNVPPAPGEPARFGFVAPTGISAFLDTSVRTGGDYGITVSSDNITESGTFLAAQLTFWGVPGDARHDRSRGYACIEAAYEVSPGACPADTVGAPFLALPTACGNPASEPFESSIAGDSWSEPGRPSVEAEPKLRKYTLEDPLDPSIAMDGCNQLAFEPSIKVTPSVPEASTSTGVNVDVHVPQEEILAPHSLAESAVKDITVRLPEGVALNPAGAGGLAGCSGGLVGFSGFGEPDPGLTTATFRAALPKPLEPGVNFCPNASKIGTVKIKTPLLPNPLEGAVYLATQDENPFGSLIAMYIVAEDPVSGTLVELPGQVALDGASGQIEATFENNPELPFEDAELEFFGGERAPLATPAHCGAYETTASIAPWSGNPPATPSSTFDITSGPNGGPCPGSSLPFSPSLTAQTTNIQAGGFSPFTMTMSRDDGNQQLQGIQLHMPPGLLGTLSSVKPCEEAQANAGTCGPESLIGETTVSVGVGGSPYTVTGGKVYITGPYHGAPYGLSIVNPAKAGPFDLEHTAKHSPPCDCLVVRAKIEVDPLTSALTVTANSGSEEDSIPTIIEGIPLQIKHVNVTIDRGGFTFNPTDCDPLKITGSLSSAEGASSSLSVPFQVTNCAALAFKPTFAAATAAHNSRVEGASLTTTVTYPSTPQGTEANIAKVKVSLPAKLPARLSTLQKACTEQIFAANPANCPAASRVGEATTSTPVLPDPLSGPAYFVSHGGAKYPELVIVLQGDNVTIDLHGETAISKKGVLTSTFDAVPDAPFSTFELKLPEGRYSALTANAANLCTSGSLSMPTELVAQDGAVINQQTKVKVTGCPKKKVKHKTKKKDGKHKRKK
jgi:uncharacterized repeat protein (TIGR01451 family)